MDAYAITLCPPEDYLLLIHQYKKEFVLYAEDEKSSPETSKGYQMCNSISKHITNHKEKLVNKFPNQLPMALSKFELFI